MASGKTVTTIDAFLVLSQDENFDRSDPNTIRRSKRYLKAIIDQEKGEEHSEDIFEEEVDVYGGHIGKPDPPIVQSKPFWFNPNDSYE